MYWATFLSFFVHALLKTVVAVKENAAQIVPGAYIVEFADGHDSTFFYSSIGSGDVAVRRRMKFDYTLFRGVSFQLEDVSDVDTAAAKIANMSVVKQMWPVRIFSVPDDEVVWKGSDRNMAQSILQTRQSANGSDTFSPHVMTQIDKLRAKGVTGKGVRIAVLDTGIDYTHPALGGCFGPGCLVSYGNDLVGDGYDGFNTPVPDPDPHDSCEGHGSHVAGIIAAQANPFDFTGAAPDVTLGAYRVFGCSGSAGNDVLIAAYNEAFEDGSDIITASIGGPSGWTEDPWAVAVQRIVEAGTPCLVAAGNEGAAGLFYASTAANGKHVTAVASIDNTEAPLILLNASYVNGNSSVKSFGWTQGEPSNWGNASLPLWTANRNASDPADGCRPYSADTPNLSGYIVLVRRGTCTFVQKAANAAAHGARYIMFYNNVPGIISVSAAAPGIEGVGMVTAEQGAQWIDLLSKNSGVVVSIVDPAFASIFVTTEPNTVSGGFASEYTSWGPTFETDVKPQIAAPGGLILSTYPLNLGGYAVISGTSMACPLVAAVYALISNVRGTLDPATIEKLLSATSIPNLFHDGLQTYPFLAPVAQQGSGLIQAYDAAYATTLLSVSSLAFNDTDHPIETTNFTISNLDTVSVTYSLSNVVAATGYTLDPNSIFPSSFPNELLRSGAELTFSDSKVTVPAGGSAVVSVSAKRPIGLEESRLPVYSGFITLNSTNGDSLSLPYLGVQGSLHNATVLDRNSTFLTQTKDPDSAPIPSNQTFVFPLTNGTASNSTNYPVIYVSLALGSPLVSAEVVPKSADVNGTITAEATSLGNIYNFPNFYLPRGGLATVWRGKLEDGSLAPAGTYTLLVKALKIFGDISTAADYETVESVEFSITYQ